MTNIKICGIWRREDIAYVNEAMPDYIGFVFAPSKRQITPDVALELKNALHPDIQTAGVFVNSPIEDISSLYRHHIIHIAQLHGNEDTAYINELKAVTGIPVIKAIRADSEDAVIAANENPSDYLLFDYGTGGTGKSFPWEFLSHCKRPFFLAGGINATNIKQAKHYRPFCIDVSSGAETDGCKDKEKILTLVKEAHL